MITLAPQFISGVSQWSDIKTDRAFIHANRMWIVLRLMDAIDQFVKSIQKQGGNVSVQGNTRSASSKMLAAQVRSYKMPEKLRQQQKGPWTTHETIQRLKNAKVPITYLESDCSDYDLIDGVKIYPEGALQKTVLPEHESSVRQITGNDEFDDHARTNGGPWHEKGYPQQRYKDRIVAIHWQHRKERHRWSIHVVKRAIVEQDRLQFHGVIAVPKTYLLTAGVNVYIGPWIGQKTCLLYTSDAADE